MNLNDLLKTKAAQDPINRAAITAAARSVGAVANSERKPDPLQALEGGSKIQERRKSSVARRLTVHIVSFRGRLLDSDNFTAGAKPLRDAVSKTLGVDDADRFVDWNYHQIIGKPFGTLVLISDA